MDQHSSTARRKGDRFHGRVHGSARRCAHPGCAGPGEFRAPVGDHRRRGFDGPGEYRWLCLDHVRDFNARYNFFDGMTTDEIYEAQSPLAGWERETRAFAGNGASPPPRWADFTDPLEAISARFRRAGSRPRANHRPLSTEDHSHLETLGLRADADRKALRRRYAELVRRYHPDRNGGDRGHEAKLRRVIEAYAALKSRPAFA